MAKVVSIDSGDRRALRLSRRDELVLAHLGLAESIARGVARSLPPSFDVDDLTGIAKVALVQAADRYSPRKHPDTPFPVYARQVIRGAVIESTRRKNWIENTRPGLEVLENGGDGGRRRAKSRVDLKPVQPIAEKRAEAGKRRRRVADALAYLPDAEQALMKAYYGPDEPTLFEVGDALGLMFQEAKEMHLAALAEVRGRLTGRAVLRRRVSAAAMA